MLPCLGELDEVKSSILLKHMDSSMLNGKLLTLKCDDLNGQDVGLVPRFHALGMWEMVPYLIRLG